MAKVMKVCGKLVKLYVFGRMTWVIVGMGYKRQAEKYDMKMWNFKTGVEAADELDDEARQGWSYLIKWFKE